ncbi:hypothetical protein K466DRAFT_204663 [Polyporus arcularius HHB13444]|uniref:Uncharacterized protein n=1 Tax=Polyporus arcularius HHB13444 TaxID=1314778 RepID=A0A5C3P5N3_9APHY|nr:hypothetical protein K466DRAFT_204663 [Polyporus arcularius HHB13444]
MPLDPRPPPHHDSPIPLSSSTIHLVVLADVRQGTAASTAGTFKFSPRICCCRCRCPLILLPSRRKRVFILANRSHPSYRPSQSPQWATRKRSRRKTVREWPRWHISRSRDGHAAHGAGSAEGQASRRWVGAAGQFEWCRCPFAGLNRSSGSTSTGANSVERKTHRHLVQA